MNQQKFVFPDEPTVPPGADAPGTLTALKFDAAKMSPAQKRFNQLIDQTESLAAKIAAAQALADSHRVKFSSTLMPLKEEYDALMRKMAWWLDERLKQKGLSAKLKAAAAEMICSLSGGLAMEGDETMQALHDAHASHSLEEQGKAVTNDIKSFMEGILGEKLGDDDQDFENLEDLVRASVAKMQAQAEATNQARADHGAKRKKTATQKKTEQQALDADSALRTLYRQLASALHPDRETNPLEQLHKTALMKEANAAYERRDLLALLQLQLQADLVDDRMINSMANEKLVALTALLKERVKVLTNELYKVERQTVAEFGLPMYAPLSPASLKRHLAAQKTELEGDIEAMQQDLAQVPDDRFLKRWLRQQHELRHDEFDPFDFANL